MRVTVVLLALACATPALAESDYFLARGLGDVIASEQLCGLSYDQAAIDAFIVENVSADDLQFPATLKGTIRMSEREQEDLSPSAVTAHCTQIRRLAASYGFVD